MVAGVAGRLARGSSGPTWASTRRPLERRAERLGVALWAVVISAALAWGTLFVADAGVSLRAAPLMGRWDVHPGGGLLPAVVLGSIVVWRGPIVAMRAPWGAIPPLVGLTAGAWTVALAASEGWSRLTAPLTTRHEYEPFAAQVGSIGDLIGGYVAGLGDHPIHVQGHPPGPVVLAWVLDRIGLGGAGWLALVVMAAWGLACGATLVVARLVAGEPAARRAAPALALLPAAVWAGTSFDALFAGLIAGGTALVVLAASRASVGGAAAGGVVLGLALLCTYGTVPLLILGVFATIAVAARPMRLLAPVLAAALAVLALAAAAGFRWLDGLMATQDAYWAGVGGRRPAVYTTLVGNPGALALTVGPAVAAGLVAALPVRPRRPLRRPGTIALGMFADRVDRASILPGAAMAAVVLANLSQLSRGEVERIWLPFVPWLALAAPGDRRGWLFGQVGLAVVLQSVLASPW